MKFLDYFDKKYPSLSHHLEKIDHIAHQLEDEEFVEMSDSLKHILKFFDDKKENQHQENDFHFYAEKIEEITGVEVNECEDLKEAMECVLDHGNPHEIAEVIHLTILAIFHHLSDERK